MSSKVGQNQQQGRRTPLSLTGSGKHAQQQQNNKTNSNLTKTQELKSSDATTGATKNGNNSATKNQELNNLTQKELKKAAQQNGNGNGNGNDAVIIEDVIAEKTKNGTANGHKNNKSNAAKTEAIKEKDNNKETETNKEKPKRSEINKQTEEKKQQETAELVIEQASTTPTPTNATKSKVENSAAKPSTPTNEKKQTSAKANTNANGQKPATPTKAIEKGTATPPAKSPGSKSGTPSKSPRGAAAKSGNETSADAEMLPLVVEQSPPKKSVVAAITPTATSTPGKVTTTKRDTKDETPLIKDNSGSPEHSTNIPRVFSQISGRRSIRPLEEFTPNMYNSQFRESYRRINTELDVTGNTNTSINVTVGSEIPNNSSFLSFSLFGRGRKRERTPPSTMPAKSQSAVELTTETTPPKRARLDVNGIFTAMSSPLTLLRSRFSKTTLESSTPTKSKELPVDDVQNVSGVSIEEVVCNSQNTAEISTEQNDTTVEKEDTAEKSPNKKSSPNKKKKADKNKDIAEPANEIANESKEAPAMDVDSDIQMKETPIIGAVGDPKAKQRGCTIM